MKFNHIVLRGLCAAGIAVSTACAGPSATSSVPAPPQLLHVPNSGMSYNTSATIDYYRFETGPSGAKVTKVVDSGTGRHNGTILAGSPTFSSQVPVPIIPHTGKTDNFSLQFATGDAASFAFEFPFQTLTAATLEFWVNPTQINAENDLFWTTTAVDSGDANRFNIGITAGGGIFIDYRDPNGVLHQLGSTSGGMLTAGEWSFIAYVKNANTYKIYVNNSQTSGVTKLLSTVTDTSPNLPTSTGWTLNGRSVEQPNSCCQASGFIDEIRLSNKALGLKAFLVSPRT